MSAYTDFLSDPSRVDLLLAEPQPYDPVNAVVVTKYYSSDQYNTGLTDSPALQAFEARIIPPGPQFSLDAFVPGTLDFSGGYSGGQLRLLSRLGDLDSLEAYGWDGRLCTLRHGGYSFKMGRWLTYAEMGQQIVEMERIDLDRNEAIIALAPRSRMFKAPIAADRYRGMPWALNFNGSTNYLSFGAAGLPTKLILRNDMTFEGWFWIDAADIGSASGIAGWNNAPVTTSPFQISKTAGDKLRFVDSAATIDQTGSLSFTGDRWWHVAISIAGTVMKFIYYDAQTRTRTVETYVVSTTTRPTADGLFYIGRQGSNYLSGATQEVRIWDAGLAEGVIDNRRMRTLETAEITSALKLYLKFGDGTGSTVTDSSASASNGTVNGTVAWYRSLEGDEDLTGEVKPCGFGHIYHATPRLVHSATREYQYHDSTPHTTTPVIHEGGNPITAGTTYTSWKTYAAATTTAGQVDILRTANGGRFRLGSNPSKPVTITFDGDASGSGYVSSAADIVRRIVTTRPVNPIADPGGLDTASFSELNSANPAVQQLYVSEETPIRDGINELLSSVGAVGFFKIDGTYSVKRLDWDGKAAVASFDERHIVSLDAFPFETPWEVLKLGFNRTYTTLTEDQLAAAVVGTGTQTFLAREFRYVTRRNRETQVEHPRAPVTVHQSQLTERGDAEKESTRRLALFDGSLGQPRAWQISVLASAPIVEFMDQVTVSLQDLSVLGVEQYRFNWANGKDAVVLGIRNDGALRTLDVWYPDGGV